MMLPWFHSFLAMLAIILYAYAGVFDSPPKAQTFYDRNDVVIGTLNAHEGGVQIWTPIQIIPPKIVESTIRAEDRFFWYHIGINPFSTARAGYENLLHGKVIRGGSTITQQLAKNMIKDLDKKVLNRTIWNKFRSTGLAIGLELKHSKSWILERYLNTAYYGNGCYGISAAAECYFSKSLTELSDYEIDQLVELPKSPNKKSRIFDVQKPTFDSGRHFMEFVSKKIGHGVNSIQTTLDETLEARLEMAIQNAVADRVVDDPLINVAAVVIEVDTGDILAMIGSRDYFDPVISGQYNAATARRQPGSALKPFTYFAAFTKGYSADTIIRDEPTGFYSDSSRDVNPYIPQNFDRRFHGEVSVREALGNSYNVPAVVALKETGISYCHDIFRRFGLTTFDKPPPHYGLAVTLGSGEVTLLELTNAYAALARGGRYSPYYYLRPHADPDSVSVVENASQYAAEVTGILSDPKARLKAFGHNENMIVEGHPVAVKTGTSYEHRDNWTVGYTAKYAVGVWVGHSDGAPLDRTTGATGAAPIWHSIMETIVRGSVPQGFPKTSYAVIDNPALRILRDPVKGWSVVSPLPHSTYRANPYIPFEHRQIMAEARIDDGFPASLNWYYDGILYASTNERPAKIWLPGDAGDHLLHVESQDGTEQDIPIRIIEGD